MFTSDVSMRGTVAIKKIKAAGPGFWWHFQNRTRWNYWLGWFNVMVARLFSGLTGIPTITSELALRVRKASGEWIDYGVVSYRVVTDAGVAFLVADWNANGQDISTMNFHGIGTGATAEAAGDTALVTESTTALNPDSTRATGTRSQPAANQYRTVGTLTADASIACTEHGIFSQAATGGGTLWDRSVFSTVNLASGDSLQSTYTCTVNSGS